MSCLRLHSNRMRIGRKKGDRHNHSRGNHPRAELGGQASVVLASCRRFVSLAIFFRMHFHLPA